MKHSFSYSFLAVTLATAFVLLMGYSPARSQNPIATENAYPGNQPSEWDISGSGDLSIQGFATDISVNKGTAVHFKIKTDATAYTISIYRIGYYQGNGARLVGTGVITAALPQTQPPDFFDLTTGLTDCGNWNESAYWAVPTDAVSGVYIAHLKRTDTGGSSHIIFIVRDDTRNAAILFKTSDATWQAYNAYGGNSLYVGGASGPPALNHASKVSYNRPFYTRNGGGGGGASEDWFFNAEYPMIRWIERNGYDVSYTTDVDMDRDASAITPSVHKILLSVGHDEYWSAAERTKFENARNAGVHLAFFSGNEVYWKTRWENNHRTLVCYKEGTLGENVCGSKCDLSTTIWTGLWRDGSPAIYAGSDGGRPENALTGQISWDGTTTAIEVPDTYKDYRFWRNTTIAALGTGQTATLPDGTLGYEWDWEQYQDSYPPGRVTLSRTTSGSHTHKLSLYRHSGGALVFGAGTVQWSWGLDENHDRGNAAPSQDMQQATANLLADMGVQPATLQAGLTPAIASTDITPPVSVITSPSNGGSFPANSSITITGMASDVGGLVAGVDVSVNGGVTWKPATGSTSWSFTWTPVTQGQVTIITHAFDDSYNVEPSRTAPSSNAIEVAITAPVAPVCPCNIWSPATVPVNITEQDPTAYELGLKFRSKLDGYITGVRFYKGPSNTGTHIGNLWTSSGTNLAQATFTNETGSGWQEVSFGTPVHITAGTTYIASYHTNTGYYSDDANFFTPPGVDTYYLQALADGVDGANGVYTQSATTTFPSSGWQSSNYYVDVVFNTSIAPDITPPVVVSVAPFNSASGVAITTHPTAIFNEALDASTANVNSVQMVGPGNTVVTGSVSCSVGTVTFTPASPLAYSTTYTLTLKGGYSTYRIKDIAGNGLSSDYTWSFSTAPPPPSSPSEGPGGPILVISAASNPFSRYPVEILRAEGLNEFFAADISTVNASTLANYDVVILGEMSLMASDVTMLTEYVNAGGTLIAFKPDPQLAPLLGITSAGGSLSDKYLLVNTASGPGVGIVAQTIQFHGPADQYTLNGATSLATLYSTATTATVHPAVTTRNVGTNGGKAIAFTYDLAKSIVYTRQGNPAWAGQKRDGAIDPIRSDDMFYPDWIDFNKIAIPQADEQQHLLSNIILQNNLHRKPLPKFWFLPRRLKAAIVMTGDDHGSGGTIARFNQYVGYGNNTAQDVLDWRAIRGTSYIYTSTPLSDVQAAAFTAQGFEIAFHLNTNCATYTLTTLQGFFNTQLPEFTSKYASIPPPVSHRTHCISWSDWASKPIVEIENGIRLNTDYYYWPDTWVQNRPGMFTGSGLPMRFADLDGTILDNYQLTTQMPDESGISFPGFINTLLDNAIGTPGYYGVFCANMHTDANTSAGSDAIIASAQARQIPVVSAKQMLTWLDARNSSSFGAITWNGNILSFSVSATPDAHKLQGMVPVTASAGHLTGITLNGAPVSYATEVIKGINYAFFDAGTGNYAATYLIDNTGPVISNVIAAPNTGGSATISWTTNEAADSRVDYGTTAGTLNLNTTNEALGTNHSITLIGLSSGTTYYFRVTSVDAATNSITEPVPPATLTFAMPTGPCASDATTTDFNAGTTDANTVVLPDGDGAVSLKPALNEGFSGTSIPSGWAEGIWDGQAGAITTYAGGQVTVNGTHLSYNTPVGPGTSMEFAATFTAGNFQNVGFTGDAAFNNPWIVIGRGNVGDNNVYARTDQAQSASLGSTLLNASHSYRIQWLTNGTFEFYVDGVLIPTPGVTQTVSNNMVVQISDYPAGGVALSVDWIRSSPYATPGTFTSRVFDGGSATNWGAVNWNADVPANTALSVSVRKGNTSVPDGSWTTFIPVPNGGSVGCSAARYIQYKADFSTTSNSVSAKLKDITVACGGVGSDVTPPVISNAVATPNSNGTATIGWTTDEAATSLVDYGTASNNLNLHGSDASLVISHSISLSSLIPGTTYYYRISSTDCSNNTATQPTANFTVPVPVAVCFQDHVTADFAAGTTGSSTYISPQNDGEVILRPAVAEEFSGTTIPSGWQSFAWTGGTSVVSGGSVTVDGARFNTVSPTTTFGPGSSMEFLATFGAGAYQHIGFGGGTDAVGNGGIYNGENPWAMFSTGTTTSVLKTRTSPGPGVYFDYDVPGPYLGTPHLYRIEWNVNSFLYYVDGTLVHTENVTIGGTMRPAISDYNNGGAVLSVDWIQLSPFAASGTFTSRIYDAGVAKTWISASWTADAPSGTALQFSQRQSNSPVAILSEPWTAIPSNGAAIGGTAQCIQYKVDLTRSSPALTPVLRDIGFSCSIPTNLSETVTCSGTGAGVSFPLSKLTMTFDVLPSGGGDVTVRRYLETPPSPTYPNPPTGSTYIPVWFDITSTMANNAFSGTITVDVTDLTGFGAGSRVMCYNATSGRWVLVSGTYNSGAHAFTFSTTHFTAFGFINGLSTAYDVYLSSSQTGATAGIVYPNDTWGGGYLPLTNDWGYTGPQPFSLYIVPQNGTTLGACELVVQYDSAVVVLDSVLFTGSIFSGPNLLYASSNRFGSGTSVTLNASLISPTNIAVGTGDYIAKLKMKVKKPGHGTVALIGDHVLSFNVGSSPSGVYITPHQAEVKAYLGDVASSGSEATGDGKIDHDDLSPWSLSYWSGVPPVGMTNYKSKYDIGPTQDGYVFSLPTHDQKIDFEDLVIFAITYGQSARNELPKVPVQSNEPLVVSLGKPEKVGDELRVPVLIGGGVTDVRAMKLELNGQFGSFLGVNKGELLRSYETPVMLMSRADGRRVYVDLAVMGLDAQSVNREGEVVVLRFAGTTSVSLVSAECRSSWNTTLGANLSRSTVGTMPTKYNLGQNYPNPFNPTTSIEYQLPQGGQVKLEVFNILGVRVATLVNDVKDAGFYQVAWDGKDENHNTVATGVYLYRVKAGEFSSVKKMLLLK